MAKYSTGLLGYLSYNTVNPSAITPPISSECKYPVSIGPSYILIIYIQFYIFSWFCSNPFYPLFKSLLDNLYPWYASNTALLKYTILRYLIYSTNTSSTLVHFALAHTSSIDQPIFLLLILLPPNTINSSYKPILIPYVYWFQLMIVLWNYVNPPYIFYLSLLTCLH